MPTTLLPAFGQGLNQITTEVSPVDAANITIPDTTGVYIIAPASGLTTLTVKLPLLPTDTQLVRIAGAVSAVAGLTLSGNGAGVVGAITSLAVGGFASYVYNQIDNKWYRVG
jgi:hypothetical protein